jgi:hypothetical protein
METRHCLWKEYRDRRKTKTNIPSVDTRYISDAPPLHQRNAPSNARTNYSHTASHDPQSTNIATQTHQNFDEGERAQAVTHSVNTTQQRTIPRHTAKKAKWHPNTPNEHSSPKFKRKGDTKLVTAATDWLIASGATTHMTHCREDFNGTLTPYDSVVETANGGIVRVTHRGSVDIFLSDAFRPDN